MVKVEVAVVEPVVVVVVAVVAVAVVAVVVVVTVVDVAVVMTASAAATETRPDQANAVIRASRRRGLTGRTAQPPIGARGLAPQNSCVPSIPIRCTETMLTTIDLAVAVPTPTGPPLAV
jgi:hypothetical protein